MAWKTRAITVTLILAFLVIAMYLTYPTGEITSSDEWFFLSVGLYQNETHPCLRHITHCEAEFKSTALNYTIVSEDGTFHIKGSGKTNVKGFFDLYLPAGKNYRVTFTIAGKQGNGIISTYKDASNCITNIKVS